MIRIFDERAYIDNYIKYGFKNISKLRRDAILYVRWLKLPIEDGGCGELLSKKECEQELLKKCRKVPYLNIDAKPEYIKTIMDKAWKDKHPLLSIKEIPVSISVMNWFRRQGLKKNEIKLLFTLYMGYLIKMEKYHDEDICTWFNQINDRDFLRGNANITTGASVKKILNVFRDKKFIQHEGKRFKITFIYLDEFKECEQGKEKFIFKTQNLEKIGNTLYAYYDEKRFCLKCGRIIPTITNKKYCDECYEQIKKEKDLRRVNKQYQKKEDKVITCIDCGKSFSVGSRSKRNRCDECYAIYRKEQKRGTMQKLRNKELNVDE